ncbi:peptide chain release factor N(5)-glutamine methyltransferase [Panacibacter sp. DH6]|uniref:peptide chain release factor N(5)-glutamine methyltransferase n=1 Tax=Panacibacter microcysteis TaxID=2793269 RepID=A0A931GU58_9BACT|nr:peptide chain release factor N(5)-glutamine methyltransferase [Panacibacter microcysteis]MBG9376316.1 peptide chain release factor N(5)-glutamine methyltransferase [Panacibacter microcysteis]
MGIQDAYNKLMYQLFERYDDREAANIADWVVEHITGFKRIDRIINKKFPLTNEQQQLLNTYTNELLQHKPVQYVLHEAWFAGMQLYVDENVLIPRPETEELVAWIVNDVTNAAFPVTTLLDVGTGSGCIPVAVKRKLPQVAVHALDVSEGALHVAESNAQTFKTPVTFYTLNILDDALWHTLPSFDIIVSNPPYIKQSEQLEMRRNVLLHEPHLALFVPDNDPLLFYKSIAAFGLTHLNKNGWLFFEINETLGNEVKALLASAGYTNIELRKDMQGKDRMVKAVFTW